MVFAMWGGEWDILWLDEVDSTNTYVRDQARQGAPEGLVVVAEHQTAGRGRLDRRWESPPGANLLASVLLRPACEEAEVYLSTAAVALAAADACSEVAGVEPVLKWPNDLLAGPDEAKLAGILAEAEFSAGALPAVVVGIGINVAWPGPEVAGGTCLDDLRAMADPVDRHELLERMLVGLAARRPLLDDEGGGVSWPTRCAGVARPSGGAVRVVLAGEELVGQAVGIDDAGHLVVETAAGTRTVSAGDVVHVRASPEAEPDATPPTPV